MPKALEAGATIAFSLLLQVLLFSSHGRAADVSLTLQVPAGTSTHGDTNLICTPTRWTDVLLFLLANYVAHVLTIVSRPGEHPRHLLYRTIIAFLFPFSGMIYSLETISRHALLVKDPLQRAGRARALCVVVRDTSWKAHVGDSIRGVQFSDFELSILRGRTTIESDHGDQRKLEEGMHALHHLPAAWSSHKGQQLPTLVYRSLYGQVSFDGKPLAEVPRGYRVSSAIEQLSQYQVVHVPTEVQVRDDEKASFQSQYAVTLSAPHTFSRTAIGIFQAVYSCVMIYVTRGDQLERYSWGAFGLSVTPYAIMSMLNTIANTLTPVHPTLHLVGSDALDESRGRGARYGFVVGHLCVPAASPRTWTGIIEEIGESQDNYIMKFVPSTGAADETLRARVRIDARAKNASLSNGPAFERAYRASWLRHTSVKCVLMAIIPFIPLAIAGGMSGFSLPQDTSSAMVMIWLVLGPIGGFSTALKLLFSDKEESFHDWKSTPWNILAYCGLVPIFGMAAVVVMLVDFGTCIRLD